MTATKNLFQGRRSFLPRFGLRSLFVFAMLFCLASAWIGRNYVRLREEEAAIEALGRVGADFICEIEETPGRDDFGIAKNYRRPEIPSRLLGWDRRPAIHGVQFHQGRRADDGSLLAATEALALFPEIRTMSFEGPGYGDEELAALRALPDLEELTLSEADATAEGLAQLGSPMRLRELRLFGNERESPGVLVGPRSWSKLHYVEIHDIPISREDVATLAALPKLSTLILENVAPQGADAYAPLKDLRSCRTLRIVDSGFRDADVAYLPKEAPLEALTVDGIHDETLSKLHVPPTLRKLGLSFPVSPAAAQAFLDDGRVRSVHYSGKPEADGTRSTFSASRGESAGDREGP